jgi:hypothetical protein
MEVSESASKAAPHVAPQTGALFLHVWLAAGVLLLFYLESILNRS